VEEFGTSSLRRRLLTAGILMLIIYGIGTGGYYIIGGGAWSLGDCAYMTVISLTTVGYGETLSGLNEIPNARLFTALLLVSGAGIALYFVSVLTTFLVEGEFLQIRRGKRMRKMISKMKDHIIVCGVGGTGRHVLEELVAARWDFVAIDTDAERLERCQEEYDHNLATINDDATDDKVLLQAGIERAHGIVASLPDDMGNLYVVVTARGFNPKLRIVAKAMDANAVRKLTMAGANSVVSVNTIGGLRMASEMIRPAVVSFLDKMMRDKDRSLRFEEVAIPAGSDLESRRLVESGLREERNVLIVAARDSQTGDYTYSPDGNFELQAGMTLILLGEAKSVQRLRKSRLFQPRS
jgi:voltage-gated potassium channel